MEGELKLILIEGEALTDGSLGKEFLMSLTCLFMMETVLLL